MSIGPELFPLECTQGFPTTWPSDLIFDQTWPSFELDKNFIKINILTQFQVDQIKTVPSRMYTS